MKLLIIFIVCCVVMVFSMQQMAIMALCPHAKTDNGFTYYCENVR